MITTLKTFLRKDLLPRWKGIIFGTEVFLSIAAAIAFEKLANKGLWAPAVEAHVFATAILTYASIALGFSIAGASVALALPERFVRVLHKSQDESGNSMYGGLIFVYAWTAAIHVILAVTSVLAFFFFTESDRLLTKTPSWENGFSASLIGFSLYCVIQFLITIAVICSVGRLYAQHLDAPRSKRPATNDGNSES